MNIQFPFNQDVENAQEKILQAKSAQEIKDLLKQDDPQRPNYQEGLIRLVSQHIMKQFSDEDVSRIESLTPHKPTPFPRDEDRGRFFEILKFAKKTDNELTSSIIADVAMKHDPVMIGKKYRESLEPHKTISRSIPDVVLNQIKNYPHTVEKIFDDLLPKIRQDEQISPVNNTANNLLKTLQDSEKTKYASSFSNENSREIEIARKAGYVQGVCECVAAIGDDHTLGKKLLSEMNVNRDMAKKFANPETFKALEQGIFAPKPEQTLEQTQSFKR